MRLFFSSLPPSLYGILETSVSVIPPDSVQTASGQSVFVVKSPISETQLGAGKKRKVTLQSGMGATARIVTGRTTAMCLFFKKFTI